MMKRIVYFENKRIIEISTMELQSDCCNRIIHNAKVYIFEDNSYIKASLTKGKKFKYVCEECGDEIFSTTKPEYNKDFPYICSKCRGLNHNGFKGKHHTENFKKKMSDDRQGWYIGKNNPMYGKSWTDYTSQDIIDKHNKKMSERMSGENNPMYGKNIKDYITEESYELWKQHVKENGYNSKSKYEQHIISNKMSSGQHRLKDSNPDYYKEIKSRGGRATMSKLKNYEKSSIEIIVERWLNEHNLNYEYSPIMGNRDNIYQYDFIIHGQRILIEVQGDYWHGNKNMFNEDGSNGKRILNDIQKNNIKRDLDKFEFALNRNFEVIYIWEEEIKNNDFSKLENIYDRICRN